MPDPWGELMIGGPPPNEASIGARAPRGALAAPAGPEIVPPQNSTIPTGKSAVPWSPSFRGPDALIDPRELANAGGGLQGLLGLLFGGNRFAGPLAGAAAGIMHTTPADTGVAPKWANPVLPGSVDPFDQRAPAPMASQPNQGGGYPVQPSLTAPTPQIAPQTTPVAVTPPARPKPRIDPAQVDLGHYQASVGNARTPVFVPQQGPAPTPIFRGPLAMPSGRDPYYG